MNLRPPGYEPDELPDCSIPRYFKAQLPFYTLAYIHNLYGAENRNRTDTMFNHRRILSPVRLPVPPPRHDIIFSQVAISSISLLALRVGLEPTTYRLTAGCSTIELPKHDSDFIIALISYFVNIFHNFFLTQPQPGRVEISYLATSLPQGRPTSTISL